MDELSENDRLAWRVWPPVVEAIDALVERANTLGEWQTLPTSPLAGDDKRSSPYQIAHAMAVLLNSGIDSLNAIRHLVFGRPGAEPEAVIHQAAHYLLARGAIENFATALWILGPTQRTERVRRVLRWHMQNAKDAHSATARYPRLAGARTLEDKMTRFQELALERTGSTIPRKEQGYTHTAVVKYATDYEGNGDELLSTFFVWQLCSGFAHGRPWAMLGFLEREPFPSDEEDVVQMRMTSDLARVLVVTKRSLHVLELLLRRHQELNRPLYP